MLPCSQNIPLRPNGQRQRTVRFDAESGTHIPPDSHWRSEHVWKTWLTEGVDTTIVFIGWYASACVSVFSVCLGAADAT